MTLKKVISGGQTGADIAGVKAAKNFGLQTGGTMPYGFRTLHGFAPEYAESYGMVEHESFQYPPRTIQNVKDSDATIRFATNMHSAGERCTMAAIKKLNKPHFDVEMTSPTILGTPTSMFPRVAAKWLFDLRVVTLNVAGNSETTCPGIEEYVNWYMLEVFALLADLDGAK